MIFIGLHPTGVANTTLYHFILSKKDGRTVFIFTEKIGDRNRSSKTKKDGIKFNKIEPVSFPIWNLDLLCGLLNGSAL